MDRRQFLSRSAGLDGITLALQLAFAEDSSNALQKNYQRFHGALVNHPQLEVYRSVTGELAGQTRMEGKLPADLSGRFQSGKMRQPRTNLLSWQLPGGVIAGIMLAHPPQSLESKYVTRSI